MNELSVQITPQVWFPIVTLLIGFATKAILDLLQEKRITKRESEKFKHQQNEIILVARIKFQFKSLDDLQMAINKLMRITGRGHHEDFMTYQSTGKWRKNLWSDFANDGFQETMLTINILNPRIRNTEVRSLTTSLTKICTKVVLSNNLHEAENMMNDMMKLSSKLNSKIGTTLRDLEILEENHLSANSKIN